MTAYVVAFVVGLVISAVWLRIVCRLTGARPIPVTDLVLITGLCSGLALFPRAGWLLAMIFLSLLLFRAERVDPWPEGVLMMVGSGIVWALIGGWVFFG